MATAEFSATVGTVTPSGRTNSNVTNAASTSTNGAAFTSALATLVADGATPTQAHVTAVNNAWTTYKANIDAMLGPDVTVFLGTVANVADMNKFRAALAAIANVAEGSALLAKGSGNP